MGKVNEGDTEIAGYGTIDFLASYQVTDEFKVNLALTNLTDKECIKYLNTAGHTNMDSLAYIIEASRGFSVSMRYDF